MELHGSTKPKYFNNRTELDRSRSGKGGLMVMVRLTKEGEGRDVIWRYLTFVLLQAINGTFSSENISHPLVNPARGIP